MKRIISLLTVCLLLAALCLPVGAQGAQGYTLPATLTVGAASPQEPTASAVLRFPDLPDGVARLCTLRWYRDGVPISQPQMLLAQKGAYAVCRITVCFSETMPASSEITAELTAGSDRWTYTQALEIQNYDAAHYARLKTLAQPYRISIGHKQNTVVVWAQAEDGTYSLVQNVFLCSTGYATPYGTYYAGEKIRWHTLYGSEKTNWNYVYGQYITRITHEILFHSVPYYTPNPDDLEADEYNLLGTRASMGCIRLTVEAAKWIYDNIPIGTPVELVDDLALPTQLPAAPQIDLSDARRGWDPTDPLPENPWKAAK